MALAEADEYLQCETYPIVRLETPFVDERGAIQNLTTKGAQSVAVIVSKAGSSRASHVHKSDDHLSFVISGRIEYFWQEGLVESDCALPSRFVPLSEIKRVVVEAGQAFYTPKHVAHTMYFPVDTVFATVSCKSREHADHEADLIRVQSLKDAA